MFFGWWSFRFQEEGATPDSPAADHDLDLDLPGMILRQGSRYRSRLFARLTFNVAALCLLASIPLGYTNEHAGGTVAYVVVALGVILFAIAYAGRSLHSLLECLREDAFDSFYGGGKLGWIYPNEDGVRCLYFSINPLPFWTLFKRDWEDGLKHPTVEQLLATNKADDLS